KTTIEADNSQAMLAAHNVKALMDSMDGRVIHQTIVIGTSHPGSGATGFALGGMLDADRALPHAQHGAALRGWSWVGENGPELIRAPGAHVLPHTASVAATRGGASGAVYHIQRLTVVANDPQQFNAKMRSYTAGLDR